MMSSSAHRATAGRDADLGDGPVTGWMPDRYGLRCPACTWLLETWIGSEARRPQARSSHVPADQAPADHVPADQGRAGRMIEVDGRLSRCPNGHDLPAIRAQSA